MTVCVVGLGRVGLPAAVTLATAHAPVVGFDPDGERLHAIEQGNVGPEPGLAEAVLAALQHDRLRLRGAPVDADAYLVCVPTPITESRRPDLAVLQQAVAGLPLHRNPGSLLLIGSTVPVGTTDGLAAKLREELPDLRVACAPERMLPGRALAEIRQTPRLVGGVDRLSTMAGVSVWEPAIDAEVVPTTARAAELAKLVENASRDVEIALANTVAGLARAHGVDQAELWRLVDRHPRVRLLEPGIGVGGHCLPVDPWFLVSAPPEGPRTPDTRLLAIARDVNDAVPGQIVRRLRRRIAAGASVAILGLAYKPDVDDLRHAPALEIARQLAAAGYDLVVHDPHAVVPPPLVAVPLPVALQRDVIVVAVAHAGYRNVTLQEHQVGIDLCNAWQ